jgi:PAS domain S-box-containing protein
MSGYVEAETDILGLVVAALEHQSTGVTIYAPVDGGSDFVHIYVNPAYQELKPFRPMAGRLYSDVWPELSDKALPRLREVLETGTPWIAREQPFVVEATEGVSQTQYYTYEITRLDSGGKAYLMNTSMQVTADVEARQALKRSEERLTTAVSAPELVLAEAGADLRYVWVHNPHRDFDPETVIGKRDDELDSSPDVARLVNLKRRVLETGQSVREEWSVERSDGRYYYDLFLQPRKNAAGQMVGVLSAAVDITPLKRVEGQLRSALERATFLSDVIEKSSQPFAYGLSDGRVLMVNPAFEQLTGYAAEELLSMESAWSDVLTPPEWRSMEARLMGLLERTGEPQRFEKEYVRKDGERVAVELLVHRLPETVDEQVIYYAFITDITERRRAEEERERTLWALRQKDRAIRQAYTDVIDAVTGGRLVIFGRDEVDAVIAPRVSRAFEISDAAELSSARAAAADFLGDVSVRNDLLIAFSEGVTNMLKHAGGGVYRFARTDRRVQLILSDKGAGIDFKHLPKATLVSGFSTASTLGMGFTLMMELADRVLLCTDSGGTVLVLEKDLGGLERSPSSGRDGIGGPTHSHGG